MALIGKHGEEFVTVAVNAVGNLYALLQGETAEGDLQTVRLDDEGRISAFVIDSVDAWDRMLYIGNAELAVRLGSPVIYDRRGNVLALCTFEQGSHGWTTVTSGNLADVSVSAVAAWVGGYAVKLTGGSTTDWEAGIERVIPSRPEGRMGLEFSLAMPGLWDYVQTTLYFYTGTQVFYGVLRWHNTGYVLQVLDNDTDYENVGVGKVLGADEQIFNVFKMVLDVDTLKYVRLMFNNQEIDTSEYDIPRAADTTSSPSIKIVILLFSRDGFNDVAYLDNVILTGAEPE